MDRAPSFVLFERRERVRGTWDLFRHSGVRSNSDIKTLGFGFAPWQGENSIADGEEILAYLEDVAQARGIDRPIRYDPHVTAANWDCRRARWTPTGRAGSRITSGKRMAVIGSGGPQSRSSESVAFYYPGNIILAAAGVSRMTLTAFLKGEPIAYGSTEQIAPRLRELGPLERASDLLVFDDLTGRQVDLDLRPEAAAPPPPRGRGRPALGVQAREVTLLPRHWAWLAEQRGGASATLRQLVEQAMRRPPDPRERRDAAYRFLAVMAGDMPRFEDAMRELYQDNPVGYDHFTHGWPAAIREHGRRLAWPDSEPDHRSR